MSFIKPVDTTSAPLLLPAFLFYILPALLLSVGGIVFSINQSIGIAIETYQANLDTVIAREAVDRLLGPVSLSNGLTKPQNESLGEFLHEEEINCIAVSQTDGELLRLYKLDPQCKPVAAEPVADCDHNGKTHCNRSV